MNKHLILLTIAVLLICVGLSGCTEESEKSKLVGTWISEDDGSISNFNENGTFYFQGFYAGTWELKLGKLFITYFDAPTAMVLSYSFTNDDKTLTLVEAEYGTTQVYTKQ